MEKYTTSSSIQVLMLLFVRLAARLMRSDNPRAVSPREGVSLPTLPGGTPSTYFSYSRIRDAKRPDWRVGRGASDSLMTVNSAIGLLFLFEIRLERADRTVFTFLSITIRDLSDAFQCKVSRSNAA